MENKTTALAEITSRTTIMQWRASVLPVAAYAAISKHKNSAQVADFGQANAFNALVSYKTKSIDSTVSLHVDIRDKALKSVALRELSLIAKDCRLAMPQRAAALEAVFEASLLDFLKRMAKYYLRANSDKLDDLEEKQLLDACANIVTKDYGAFSYIEIEAAFEQAAKSKTTQAYGQLSIQLLHQILGTYKTRRNKCLSFLLDKEAEEEKTLDLLNNVAQKNEIEYQKALDELAALAMQNKSHRTFHTCPHHYVEDMIKDGVLEFAPDGKRDAYKAALGFAAYDLKNDAKGVEEMNAIVALTNSMNIAPRPSERNPIDKNVFKEKGTPHSFDFANPTKQAFLKYAREYYCKVLYFRSCAPYSK